MVIPAEASGGAAKTTPKPQISEAEEIRQMKLQINKARQEQAAKKADQERQAKQKTADDDVTKKKQALDPHVNNYKSQAQTHQDQWWKQHQSEYTHKSKKEIGDAWWGEWQKSEEGKKAEADVNPYLTNYGVAAQHDLRVTAENAAATGADVKTAVDRKTADLQSHTGDDFKDSITNGILDKAGSRVRNESAPMRKAALEVDDAFTKNNQALTNLHDVQARRDKALAGVHNGGLRMEIRDGFNEEMRTAQTAVDQSAVDLKTAVDNKYMLVVTESNLTHAQAGMDGLKGLPSGVRRAEMADTQQYLSTAKQQYQDAVNGNLDLSELKQYTPEELTGAYKTLVSDNPELQLPENVTPQWLQSNPNAEVALHLAEVTSALTVRPKLDMNMTTLSVDKNSPQWMQDLVATGDRTTAAMAQSLGVGNTAPKTEAEKILAKQDPLTFIMLAYSDPNHNFDMKVGEDNLNLNNEAVVAQGRELASQAFQALTTGSKATNESRAKAQEFNNLFSAADYVRADNVHQQWEQFKATHTVEQSLDQMMDNYLEEEDFNNPDAKPASDTGKFLQTLQVNMSRASTAEHQEMIWNGVSSGVTNFINQQADHIQTHYSEEDGYSAIIGEWQKQIGQFATPQVANAAIDATTSHFDPTLIGKHGGGRMTDGLQLLADRAPESAGKIAKWATDVDEKDSYQVPVADLITVKQNGTGAVLGSAMLGELRADGMDRYALENLQSYYDTSYKAAEDKLGDTAAKESFDNFNANLRPNVQKVFDDIAQRSGDFYTKKYQFGNDPKTDNEYGRKLGLTPDVNPDGTPNNGMTLVSYNTSGSESTNKSGNDNIALYTDPEKLAKIHELKQIDWMSQGLRIPLDMTSVTKMIATGVDPLSDQSTLDEAGKQNLRKINKGRDWIKEVGGDNALVTFMPAVYTSPSQGVQEIFLTRVEGDKNKDGKITRSETTQSAGGRAGAGAVTLEDEDKIVDMSQLDPAMGHENVIRQYNDFEAFQKKNTYDDEGRIYMAKANADGEMLLHADKNGHFDNINFEGVEAAITTGWEHVRRWGDVAIGVAGLAAGFALAVGTGGLAAPLVAGAAAVWFGMRTAETAGEMREGGQSFNPFNPHAKGAWFGLVDPTAGGFWLGAIASAAGLAELRPLALAGSFTKLGRSATIADEALLSSRLGKTSTEFSRGFWTNMIGGGPLKRLGMGEGLQANLYRAQLAGLPRALSRVSRTSGGALMAGQGWSFADMIASGQMNWGDWSIDSANWDFALMGGGAANMGLGALHKGALQQAKETRSDTEDALSDTGQLRTVATEPSEAPVVLSAHRGEDGTLTFRRVNVDGLLPSEADIALGQGRLPPGVVVIETTAQEGGNVSLDNIHFLNPTPDAPASKNNNAPVIAKTGRDPSVTAGPKNVAALSINEVLNGKNPISAVPVKDNVNPTKLDRIKGNNRPVQQGTKDNGETVPLNENTAGLDRLAYALAAHLDGGNTGDNMPVTAAQRKQLQDLFTALDDNFLAQIASYRRPQMRTASDALYIVRPSILENNAKGRLPPGTDTSKFAAFVAYDGGEASAIFFKDAISRRPVETQRHLIGHELAHYYAHPEFVKLASSLRINPRHPLSNLGEGAADYISQSFLKGSDKDITSVHYPAETRVIREIIGKIGKDTFQKAFFQGDQAALDKFLEAAIKTRKVAWVGNSDTTLGNLPGFASAPRPRDVPADSYAGGRWKGFYDDLRNGRISFPEDRYVYVVATPKGTGTTAFGREDIVLRGTIRAGSRDVTQWQTRAASGKGWTKQGPRDVNGNTSLQVFGRPPAGKEFHFIVTEAKPGSILNTKNQMQTSGLAAISPKTRKTPPTPTTPPTDIPISGQGYAASDWSLFFKRVQGGQLQYRGDRYVYVAEVPRDNSLKFKPTELRAAGKLQRGGTDLTWDNSPIQGTADYTFVPNVGGKKVSDIFNAPATAAGGTPGGRVFKFFVTHLPPDQITGAAGLLNVNYRATVPGARPSVTGPLPKDPLRNPHRASPLPHEQQLIRGIAKDDAKLRKQGATLDDVLDSIFPGGRPKLEPTPLLVQQLDVIHHSKFIERYSHKGHEHPEPYDGRLTPEGRARNVVDRAWRPVGGHLAARSGAKAMQNWEESVAGATTPTRVVPDELLRVLGMPSGTPYTVRLALFRGPYAENWIAGIPQNCGHAGHYTASDPRPPTYRGSPALDARHISEYRNVVANFSDWVGHMKKVASNPALGPDKAAEIDRLAFERNDTGLHTYLDSLSIDPALKNQIFKLATTNQTRPHLALNMHMAITGFKPGSKESAFYLVDRFIEYYQLIGGVGETTLIKENINKQLETLGEHFDFDNPDHRLGLMVWMTTTKLFEKHAQIHSDNHEAPIGNDGRLERGIKDAYVQREKFVRLFAPFAKLNPAAWFLKSGGVTHAHAGGGRYAALDGTFVPNTHPDINGLNYGPKITRQYHELETMVRDNPDFLSDNSWNDNSFAMGSDPNLRHDHQVFMRRHGHFIDGSDGIKSVNPGQARQHGTDDLPSKVELGLTDKQALLNLMRKSFEKTVHGGKLDSAKLQDIAAHFDDLVGRIASGNSKTGARPVLDDIAAAYIREFNAEPGKKAEIVDTLKALADKIRNAPPPKEYPIMDKVWNGETVKDSTGKDIVIVRGRKQAREEAEEAFAKYSFDDVRQKVISWDVADEPTLPQPTGPLPAYFQPKKPVQLDRRNTKQVERQEGTSAGYPRAPVGRVQATAELMGDIAPAIAGIAAGGLTFPSVGEFATILRQAGFRNVVNRLETERLRWENIHEEAQATDESLNVYLGQILKVGSEMGLDQPDLKNLAVLLDQLRTDFTYIREQTASWGPDRAEQIFDLEMASVGNSQIRGDAATGVQTSTLSTTSARTKAGRARLQRINATAAATIGGSALNTMSIFQHPQFTGVWEALAKGGSVAQTTVTSVALGIMIGRGIATNRAGRQLTNPELNKLYSKLQYNVLRGIKYSAGASVAYDAMVTAATQINHSGSWVEPTAKGIAALITYGLAARAQKYEGMKLLDADIKGAQMPAKNADTTKWLLAGLALGALTGLVFQAIRDGKDYLDKEDKQSDGLKYADERLQVAQDELTDKQSAFSDADRNLTTARNNLNAANTALTQAQNTVNNLPANATALQRQQAQTALDKARTAQEAAKTALETAQSTYDKAQKERDAAQTEATDAQNDFNTLQSAVNTLNSAKTTLDAKKGAFDTADRNLTTARNNLTAKETALTQAQNKLNSLPANATTQQRQQAQTAVNDARTERDNARAAVTPAQSAYDKAKKEHDDAQTAVANAQSHVDDVNVAYQEAEKTWQQDFFPISELVHIPG